MRNLTIPVALLFLGAASTALAGDRQVSVQGGKMATRMVNGKMMLTGIQGKVGGGQIHMAGRVLVDSEKANSATVKFDDLSVAQAAQIVGHPGLGVFLGNAAISGFIKGQWQGEGLKEIVASADGTLTINTGPGVITSTVILDHLEKMTGIAYLPELRYTGISLEATAMDGKIKVKSITANGPNFKLSGTGTYLAKSDQLDMVVNASVSSEMAAKSSYMKLSSVMSFLRGEEKPEVGQFVTVPRMIVSGELMKPDVKFEKGTEVAANSDDYKAKPSVAGSFGRISKVLLSQAK